MRVFCVTSGKGGVGKTTLTVNLGITMARMGKRVLLLDGDLGLANVNVMLKITPKFTIYDVIRGYKRMSEIILPTPYGIDLIAGASGIAELADLQEPERENFLRSIDEISSYDILIIDTGAGISDNVIQFLLAADDVIVVATPDPAAMTDAYGLIKTILKNENKPLKLIVNRAASRADARRVAQCLTDVTTRFMQGSIEFLGYIPADPLIERSVLNQKPHVVLNPRSPSAISLREIVDQLLEKPATESGTGVMSMIKKLLSMGKKQGLSDESVFEIVGNEVASGIRRSGLWTMALTEAEWDERKAKTLYIKYRVQQVKADMASAAKLGWLEGTPSQEVYEYLRRPISIDTYLQKYRVNQKSVEKAISVGKIRAFIDQGHFWVEDLPIHET